MELKTERKKNQSKALNTYSNEDININKFINYINALSESIKEYYKVSINITQNKNILIKSLETEINSLIPNSKTISNKITDLFFKLQINNNSSIENLKNFFEDVKIIFQKMKDYNKIINNRIQKQRSYIGISPNIINNTNNFQNLYQNSEMNYVIDDNQNNFFIKKDNYIINSKDKYNNNRNKSNSLIRARKKNLNELKIINNTNDNINDSNNKSIEEMEKLKKMNKYYQIKIKDLNIELEKYKNLNNNEKNDNELIKDELILNKDKIISSLKEDLKKSNTKNAQLFNKIKSLQVIIRQLKGEKSESSKSNESNKNNNNNLFVKVNNLMKQNKKLQSTINSMKSFYISPKSEQTYNLNQNINKSETSINLETHNNLLKNKISVLEKKLNEEHIEKKKNENILLIKNKNESELSRKNKELSINLMNKEKEIINLQKEILDKTKEIENLKLIMNSKDNKEKDNLIESIKSIFEQDNDNNKPWGNLNESINRILDNYKKENDQLKIIQKNFEEKIKYLQEQLKNTKNLLIEKIKTNIEIENRNKKQINVLKNEFDIKMEQVENKNIDMTNKLNSLKELYNELMKEKKELSEEIAGKELKIIQLQLQNQKYKDEIDKLNNIKLSNRILDENNETNIKKEYIELNKKLKEEKDMNKELNNEISKIKEENEKYKNELLMLGVNFIGDQKIEMPKDEIIEKLNYEKEQLKQRNKTLSEMVENLTNQFWNDKVTHNEKDENIIKNEKENKHSEEIKGKYNKFENEIKLLKKENEKLTNQIIRLSTNLPEEYNELQKQYNDLNNKYKQLLKNEKNNNNNINNNINNININNINNNNEGMIKLINDLKKENEQIKKKNRELIAQLDEKEIKRNCYDNKSEDAYLSNYEEEFDLKKMAKGIKEKNRSQDINIDYPGIQNIKEKYRELDFYYNSLEGLVKKLLTTIQVNQKNKTYVSELCKMVGFDVETSNKILNNKNKKSLLGLFP